MRVLFLPACLTLHLSSLRDPAAVAPTARSALLWRSTLPCEAVSGRSHGGQVTELKFPLRALSELRTRDAGRFPRELAGPGQEQRLFRLASVAVFLSHSHRLNAFHCRVALAARVFEVWLFIEPKHNAAVPASAQIIGTYQAAKPYQVAGSVSTFSAILKEMEHITEWT